MPSISFIPPQLLALLAIGRTTGLVVDVGYLETVVLPVSRLVSPGVCVLLRSETMPCPLSRYTSPDHSTRTYNPPHSPLAICTLHCASFSTTSPPTSRPSPRSRQPRSQPRSVPANASTRTFSPERASSRRCSVQAASSDLSPRPLARVKMTRCLAETIRTSRLDWVQERWTSTSLHPPPPPLRGQSHIPRHLYHLTCRRSRGGTQSLARRVL